MNSEPQQRTTRCLGLMQRGFPVEQTQRATCRITAAGFLPVHLVPVLFNRFRLMAVDLRQFSLGLAVDPAAVNL